ncbi:MAG: hypothetical protein EA396_14285 [Anaerolineaceae bacterium]|nr:MAG: hypothetical protein EA396_14285 [Anaerolineaceae bacterium]
MAEQTQPADMSRWPLVIAGGFFLIMLAIFVVAFIVLSGEDTGMDADDITETAYMDIVTPLLVDADPERGREHFQRYGCTACHGNQNLAPAVDVMIASAGERRPPMQAVAYIYESIIYPGAFVVPGYQNNMPRTYSDTIDEAHLGDLIAFLSGVEAEPAPEIPEDDPLSIETPSGDDATDADEEFALSADGNVILTPALIREYEDLAEFLLAGANPERGPELVIEYGCSVCHGDLAAGILAAGYAEMGQMAAERRPPLSAAAYLYEAIIYPRRNTVEGWDDNMPDDYAEMISTVDLGDIIAYLLTYADE